MTFLPVQTVRRLYDDQTLAVIQDLIGGVPINQASGAIASQLIDPDAWRSMYKGPLDMSGTFAAEQTWAFARAIAYDRYLPTIVLPHVRRMQQASNFRAPCEVVYFPNAIGILHRANGRICEQDHPRAVQEIMCLVTRDIDRTQDLIRRHSPFTQTLWRWLDHLHAASVPCDGLKLPRVEHLLRRAQAAPLKLTPG